MTQASGTNSLKEELMSRLRAKIGQCGRCGLAAGRNHPVPGDGSLNAALMIVGEGPGADEDEQGIPFVGEAGGLLNGILGAVHIDRKDIYITNVVKCRPPGNRTPFIEEIAACQRFLEAQIAIINPRIIVSLGNTPTKWFLSTTEGITKIRGQWFSWKGIDFMPMFHPSYLLRNDSRRKGSPKDLTWMDIQEVKKRLDRYQ